MVQWLRPHTFTAKSPDSIPGQGIKIPQDTGIAKKKSYIFKTIHIHTHTEWRQWKWGEQGGREKKALTFAWTTPPSSFFFYWSKI